MLNKDIARALRPTLVRLEDPKSTAAMPLYLYYTDFHRDITQGNVTYVANILKDVKNVKYTKQLTAHKTKVRFSGLDQEQLDLVLNNKSSFLKKSIRITQLFLDPITEEPIQNELVLFEGLITGASVTDSKSGLKNSSVIEWECSNHFSDFQQVVGRITDDFAHRGKVVVNGKWAPSIATKRPEYAFDKGFFHANKSTSILAQYQTEVKKFKMVKKKNWHGMSSDYRMKEYTDIETREVDLRFDLSAKYIPIVYGVQKVPAIPIFADTEVNDPSSVWAVYAICEGEIEGFYDFILDDAPIICMGAADKEQRVCFGSKKTRGDTLNTSVMPNREGRSANTEHGQHYVFDDGNGEINMWTYHGKSNQAACPILTQRAADGGFFLQKEQGMGSEYWDNTFRLLDTAYVVINYKLDDIGGGRTTIPSLEVEVHGKQVKTMVNGSLLSKGKTSTNMAWQLLDYLTSYRYGMSIPLGEIDLSTFEDVAAKLDRVDDSYQANWVPFWRYVGWNDKSASNKHIMQTNVTLPSETSVFKNVDAMLSQVQASLNKFSGKYILQVESDNPPVMDINLDDDSINSISVKDLSGTKKYNTVSASIADPGKGWATNSITFYDETYKREDRGVEKKLSLSFPFITNYYTARSLVDRELNKSRFARSISFTLPFHYIGSLLPNNNVTISYERYSWDKLPLLIEDVDIQPDGKLKITAVEFPKSVFINDGQADTSIEQDPTVGNIVLPVRDLKFNVPSELSEVPNLNGVLSWLPSMSTNISHYAVFWEGAEALELVTADPTANPTDRVEFNVTNMPLGKRIFFVRAVSVYGSFSAAKSIVVDIDPTSVLPDVENFKLVNLEPGYTDRFIHNYAELTWDEVKSEQDIKYHLDIMDKNQTIVRSVFVEGEDYLYTLKFNKEDYAKLKGEIGAHRTLRFRIRAESISGTSINWTLLE